jgi:hypothetical protein
MLSEKILTANAKVPLNNEAIEDRSERTKEISFLPEVIPPQKIVDR